MTLWSVRGFITNRTFTDYCYSSHSGYRDCRASDQPDSSLRGLLTVEEIHSTSTQAMLVVLSDLSSELIRRQLPCGGWSALLSCAQAALEPTCYSLLALGTQAADVRERARTFLLHAQNPNGSWPVFAGDDHEGSWLTSLVAVTLRDFVSAIPARLKGFHWLLTNAGKEGDWFWKWKFRTTDRHVQFDPDKFGWPWFPATVSWVVPTAFATLALNQFPCSCGGFELTPSRVDRGVDMLIDRACPGGGWNAGNGVVYGTAVAPHCDDTAIALLALHNRPQHPITQTGLKYLERTSPTVTAPWSLAWAILALAAYRRPISVLRRALLDLPDLFYLDDTSTLALVCLALDHEQALANIGVTP